MSNEKKALWDVSAELQFALSDLEKVRFLTNTVMDSTELEPSRLGTIGRAELLLRFHELNVLSAILSDEVHELSERLKNVSAVAEDLYNETTAPKAS